MTRKAKDMLTALQCGVDWVQTPKEWARTFDENHEATQEKAVETRDQVQATYGGVRPVSRRK